MKEIIVQDFWCMIQYVYIILVGSHSVPTTITSPTKTTISTSNYIVYFVEWSFTLIIYIIFFPLWNLLRVFSNWNLYLKRYFFRNLSNWLFIYYLYIHTDISKCPQIHDKWFNSILTDQSSKPTTISFAQSAPTTGELL